MGWALRAASISGEHLFAASHGHCDRVVMSLSMASFRRSSCEPVWPLELLPASLIVLCNKLIAILNVNHHYVMDDLASALLEQCLLV